MSNKLLKADEVASILDVSKSFVYQLIRTGQLQAVRIGTAVRVRPEDLDAFVQANLANKQDPWFSKLGGFQH
jgi:putative molybdopterin biosynthesis protein